MSESQSRYSIVKDLTENKMKLLDELNAKMGDKYRILRDIEVSERDLDFYKENYESTAQQAIKNKENAISNLKSDLKNLEENEGKRVETVNSKIKTIEMALKDLKEISKISLEQEK